MSPNVVYVGDLVERGPRYKLPYPMLVTSVHPTYFRGLMA